MIKTGTAPIVDRRSRVMAMNEIDRTLLSVRFEAVRFLGRDITDEEWDYALPLAVDKLLWIVRREGTDGGKRDTPRYLGKLVQEQISDVAFCAETGAMMAARP